MSQLHNAENFAGRVRYARLVIMSGRETSREFDGCFEMCDGAEVAAVLYNEADRNPKLASRIGSYIVPPKGHLRGKSFAQLKAIAADSRDRAAAEFAESLGSK